MTHRIQSLREPVRLVQAYPLARSSMVVCPPDCDPVQVEVIVSTVGEWFALPAASEAGWSSNTFGDVLVATRVIG